MKAMVMVMVMMVVVVMIMVVMMINCSYSSLWIVFQGLCSIITITSFHLCLRTVLCFYRQESRNSIFIYF